jgi:predicted lipoprotein
VDALGIDPSIDSWPLNTPDLQAFLAANPNATQDDVENAGDDLRGFHAIEFLLFGDGVDDNDKLASELTEAEINYLVALGQAFAARTQVLVDSWTVDFNSQGPYAEQIKSPGAGKIYGGDAAVLEELIGGIITIADETGNAKMAEPFGTSAQDADTSKVESQYSWNSLTDFHNNLQSILNLYTGKLGFDPATDTVSVAQNGLYAFVNAHDPALAQRVLDEIVSAQKKIALIKGDGDDSSTVIDGDAKPFREQIKDEAGRELILDAIIDCNVLVTTLSSDVLPQVGETDFTN